MKFKGILKTCLLTGLGFIILIIILVSLKDKILNLNRPVDAKILVVEGWLRSFELELIKKDLNLDKYNTIYVTGIAHNHPDYLLDSPKSEVNEMPTKLVINGCLGLRKTALKKLKTSISEIQVFAHGSKALEEYAHFFLTIDDQVIGSTSVNEKSSNYTYNNFKPLTPTRGIYVYYDNDLYYNKEDRNLIVDSISVNGIIFNKASDFYQIYDNHLDDNLFSNYPFRSNAVAAANYLKAIGVKNNIVVVDTFFNKRNKTLASAIRFTNFIKNNPKEINAFNIVSINGHSRRSYLAYLAATASIKPKIGIISLDDKILKRKRPIKERIHYFFKEYFSLFVTWIIKICS